MSSEMYNAITSQIESTEKNLIELENKVDDIIKGKIECEEPEILEVLKDKNARLKYRINILRRSIEEIEGKDKVPSILHELKKLFLVAIKKAFPSIQNLPPVSVSTINSAKANFGDYQCNSAMAIFKILKTQNVATKPVKVAQDIADNIPSNPLIHSATVSEPGFINIKLNVKYVSDQLAKVVTNGVLPPPLKKQKIVIDFSSPNIAKEMHVGHLRSTIIGESIARLLEFCGHEVLRLNHIGDWGTQFGMLISHLMTAYPDYKNSIPNISQLLTLYKESKARFDSEEDFKKKAYSLVVLLQNKDPEIYALWKRICAVSRTEFNKIYKRLDVNVNERGESFYQDLMVEVVEELRKKDVLVFDEGRYIMYCKNQKVPLTIVKSDGGYTYATSDMSALRQRVDVEKADWVIYVVDSGQALHLNTVFDCCREIGWADPSKVRIDHVGFGVVLGEDRKKFKTRSGDSVRLVDLLDEGLQRAQQKLMEKERNQVLNEEELKAAQEAVAYGCIKYADLSHCRLNEYVFSFDKMLDDKGNTAVYLLYAFTRISSISRTANVTREQLLEAAKSSIDLSHPKEWKLGKTILKFSEVLVDIIDDLFLHTLCDYLCNLATTFSEFYDVCYCVEKDKTGQIVKVNMNRMLLCEATAAALKTGLDILGIKTVPKM